MRRQVADIQAEHHLLRDARAQHDARRFGVEPEVEFRRVRSVARHVNIAAHENDALDLGLDFRLHAQRQRDIGHRSQRQNGDFAGMALDFGDQEFDRVRVMRLAAESLRAGRGLHFVRILRERADVVRASPSGVPTSLRHGRPCAPAAIGAGVHRHLGLLQQVQDVEHVLGALWRARHCRERS